MSSNSRQPNAPQTDRPGSSLPVIKAQLQFQLSTLTDESFSKNVAEIDALIESNGVEANSHLIRRLILQSAPALQAPANTPIPSPTPNAYLLLRLLFYSVRKLAKDPLLTHRYRDAFQSGLNDTSAGSTSFEAFRYLGENLAAFCDRGGFNGLERLVLALEMVKVLIPPVQTNGTTSTVVRNAVTLYGKSKEFGLAAVKLLRSSWDVGIEGLAAGQNGDTVGPVALSRILDRVTSDWRIDAEKGEAGVWDEDHGEALLDVEQKRNLVRSIWARLGKELAVQVTVHSLGAWNLLQPPQLWLSCTAFAQILSSARLNLCEQ